MELVLELFTKVIDHSAPQNGRRSVRLCRVRMRRDQQQAQQPVAAAKAANDARESATPIQIFVVSFMTVPYVRGSGAAIMLFLPGKGHPAPSRPFARKRNPRPPFAQLARIEIDGGIPQRELVCTLLPGSFGTLHSKPIDDVGPAARVPSKIWMARNGSGLFEKFWRCSS